MPSTFFQRWFQSLSRTRRGAPRSAFRRVRPQLERLEERIVKTANISLANGVLRAVCDNAPTAVTLRQVGSTTILNGVQVPTARFSRIEILGGAANDVIRILDTPAGKPVFVRSGGGSDVVHVGNAANLLNTLQGPLTVDGGGGIDSLFVHDNGSSVGRAYTAGANFLSRAGAARITFSAATETTRLDAGAGNDQVQVLAPPGLNRLTVNGGGGLNTLLGPNTATVWRITQTNGGTLNGGAVSFANFSTLRGGSAADAFLLANGQGVRGVIDGGTGVNTLDYGAFTTGVFVNLNSGMATGAAGGVRNVQNVRGGAANDILVGTPGDNLLDGRAGSDLLDGRGGNDQLLNGDGQDDDGNPGIAASVSAVYDTADGVLRISGTNNADNIRIVRNADNTISIDGVTIRLIAGGKTIRVSSLTSLAVTSIEVQAGGGDDTVIFDDALSSGVPTRVIFNGGDGNDSLTGGKGNDVFQASAGRDTANGGAGDDTFIAGPDGALFDGGDGNDYARGGAGNDVLIGGAGDDFLYGEGGDDTLLGRAGNDNLDGGAGMDYLMGQEGNDQLRGGDGEDFLYGGDGNDTALGGAGNDEIRGDAGDDRIEGGDGNDKLYGGDGNDRIEGGAGNDRIEGGTGNDTIYGGAGDDNLSGNDGIDTMYGDDPWGGTGFDSMYGGAGDDLMAGQGGDDLMYGEAGNDAMGGGDGNDKMYGDAPWAGSGNDSLYGGAGADLLVGGDGQDLLSGEDGHDALYGDNGNDKLYGGEGDDWLIGGNGNDLLSGNAGNDVLIGSSWDAVNQRVDPFETGGGNDRLYGGDGEDWLHGGDGDDFLHGGDGVDFLNGGAGDDIVATGTGGSDRGESVFLGGGVNYAFISPGTTVWDAETGTNLVFTVPGPAPVNIGQVQQAQTLTKEQQKNAFDKICEDVLGFAFSDFKRIKNGELKASEAGSKIFGIAARAIIGIGGSPISIKLVASLDKFLEKALGFGIITTAEQYGAAYGDMVSDFVDILKGTDKGTAGETIGKLTAMATYASGLWVALPGGAIPLVFGQDGWEWIKDAAAKVGKAIEDAWNDFKDWLGNLF